MVINVKDLTNNGFDPTPNTPRKGKDETDSVKGAGQYGSKSAWDEIDAADLILGVEEIARKYSDSVSQKAKAYASDRWAKNFDSDEELYEKAKAGVDEIYGGKEETLGQKRDAKVESLNAQKAVQESARTAAIGKLSAENLKAQSALLESLSRRGLTHSSVGDLSQANLRSGYREAIRSAAEEYDAKIRVLDSKIEEADAAYATALKNYEIDYAIRVENKLNRLKSERTRAIKAYESEHAADKEKSYNYYLFRDAAENKAYEDEHGDYSGEKKENYQARYDYLTGALAGRSKASVSRFLSDNEAFLRKYLGLYYDRFIKEVS